jgi:hypothetical protein
MNARSWPGLPVRSRARQQSFGSISGLPNGSCRQAPRTGSPGHQESFVAVSSPRCLAIIAAILERLAIEHILTHLGLHPQPRPNGRSARRPGPIARVARLRPSHSRHKRPPHDAAARQLRARSLGGSGHCIRQTLVASEFTLGRVRHHCRIARKALAH